MPSISDPTPDQQKGKSHRFLLTGLSSDPLWKRLAALTGWPESNRLCFVIPNYRYRTFLERELLRLSGKTGVVLPDILPIDQVWETEVLKPVHKRLETADQRSWIIRKAIRLAGKDLTGNSPVEGWIEPVSKTFRLLDSVAPGGLTNQLNDPAIRDLFGSDADLLGKLWPVYREFRSLQDKVGVVSREQIGEYFSPDLACDSQYDSVVFCGLDEWIPAHWEFLTRFTRHVGLVIWMDDLYHEKPDQKPEWSIFLPPHHHECFSSEVAKPHSLTGFRTAREETEWIAASIRESGLTLHDCCVVVPDPASYHPWISMVFRESGLPFNLSIGTRVSSTPVGRLIHDWLQITGGDSGYREMKAFLLNPIINRPDQVDWLDRVMEFQPEPAALEDWLRASYPPGTRKDDSFWKSVSRHADELNGCTRFSHWCHQLSGWLTSLIQFREATDRNLMPFEGWQAFNLIQKTLDQLATESGWDHLLDPADYSIYVRQRLLSLSTRPPVRNGIQVLGPMEVQGYRFSHVYLCGLNHRFFPSRPATGTLISYRTLSGVDEYFIRQFLRKEESSFNRVLSNAVNQVVLTGSLAQGDSHFYPSVFVQKRGIPVVWWEKPTLGSGGIRQALIRADGNSTWPAFIRDRRKVANHQSMTGWWTPWDGWFSETISPFWNPVLEKLRTNMSVTRLDRYAHCGQQFWYEVVLRLKQPDEFDPVMNAAERGKVLHETLRRFIAAHDGVPDPFRPDEEIMQDLKAHFLEVAGQAYQTGQFMHESEKQFILNSPSSPLVHFWMVEKALRHTFPQLRTSFTEQSFGRQEPDSWPPLVHREWIFSGTIDRIDRINDKENAAGIVDYKTSAKDKTGEMIANFRAFQLLVYAMAASEHDLEPRFLTNFLLGGKPVDLHSRLQPWLGPLTDFRAIAGNNKVGGRLTRLVEKNGLTSFTDQWKLALDETLSRLEAGQFSMNPTAHKSGSAGCPDFCDYRQLCRRDPDRTAVLSADLAAGDE